MKRTAALVALIAVATTGAASLMPGNESYGSTGTAHSSTSVPPPGTGGSSTSKGADTSTPKAGSAAAPKGTGDRTLEGSTTEVKSQRSNSAPTSDKVESAPRYQNPSEQIGSKSADDILQEESAKMSKDGGTSNHSENRGDTSASKGSSSTSSSTTTSATGKVGASAGQKESGAASTPNGAHR